MDSRFGHDHDSIPPSHVYLIQLDLRRVCSVRTLATSTAISNTLRLLLGIPFDKPPEKLGRLLNFVGHPARFS